MVEKIMDSLSSVSLVPHFALQGGAEQAIALASSVTTTASPEAGELCTTALNSVAILTQALLLALLVAAAASATWHSKLIPNSWRLRASAWRLTQTQAISAHEVTATLAGGALIATSLLSSVAVSGEDDLIDSAAIGVFAFVGCTIGAALTALGALLAYVASPVGSGAVWRKVVFDDAVNFGLYVLRVFLCWTRYIFYDLQVEGVDIALQQTDALFVATTSTEQGALEAMLWVALDTVALVTQLGLSLAKLFLAAFLLWLVVDLFVLRPLVKVTSRWRAL
jgi:hypothetical protein